MVTTFKNIKSLFYYVNDNKSCKKAYNRSILYKGRPISKMDIYKCPKPKKIMKLFFIFFTPLK